MELGISNSELRIPHYALYDGDKLVEMQSKAYDTEISFTTDKTYTAARLWYGKALSMQSLFARLKS